MLSHLCEFNHVRATPVLCCHVVAIRDANHAMLPFGNASGPRSQINLEHAPRCLDTLAAPGSLTTREGLRLHRLSGVLAFRLRSVLRAFAAVDLINRVNNQLSSREYGMTYMATRSHDPDLTLELILTRSQLFFAIRTY